MREDVIVHVTDFHLRELDDVNEHLRDRYYDEYFAALADEVARVSPGPCSGLVVTGDLVDRGRLELVPHAQVRLECLCNKLGVPPGAVGLCIGNHDVDRSLERAGDASGARRSFGGLRSAFGGPEQWASAGNGRTKLFNLNENIYFFSIDSTLGSGGEDRPGDFSPGECDELVERVKSLPREALVILGSHHPAHSAAMQSVALDASPPDWAMRHLWSAGSVLQSRLSKCALREKRRIVWLSGDIHKNFILEHGVLFATTGRLGTVLGTPEPQIRRQARMIAFPRDSAETPRAALLEFRPETFRAQAEDGTWGAASEELLVVSRSGRGFSDARARDGSMGEPRTGAGEYSPGMRGGGDSAGIEAAVGVTEEIRGDDIPRGASAARPGELHIETIDLVLESEIMQAIRGAGLYSLGRFEPWDDQVSLSWVSIGPLLNEGEILSSVVERMTGWLRKRIPERVIPGTLLVGTDCWGAVLASQLSVTLGCPSYCLALRSDSHGGDGSGLLDGELRGLLEGCSYIVIVSDVVATGRSLLHLWRHMTAVCDGVGAVPCMVLAVLCDAEQRREGDFSFVEILGAACSALRMPILNAGDLPDHGILAPDLTFGD